MYKALTSLALLSASLTDSASAHGDPVYHSKTKQFCLEVTDLFGDQANDMESELHYQDSDIHYLEKLPIGDVYFARPSGIGVCADNDRIHAIQLALTTHDPTEGNHAITKEDKKELFQASQQANSLFGEINVGSLHPMSLIGTRSGQCTILDIDYDDKIKTIEMESDGLMIRKLTITLQSGKGMVFGAYQGPWGDGKLQERFTLDLVSTLLGFYANVVKDPNHQEQSYISSIGLVKNDCPIDDIVKFERELGWYGPETEISKTSKNVGKVFVILLIVAFVSLGAYCLLKNRGKLCKKDRHVPTEVNQDSMQISNIQPDHRPGQASIDNETPQSMKESDRVVIAKDRE